MYNLMNTILFYKFETLKNYERGTVLDSRNRLEHILPYSLLQQIKLLVFYNFCTRKFAKKILICIY